MPGEGLLASQPSAHPSFIELSFGPGGHQRGVETSGRDDSKQHESSEPRGPGKVLAGLRAGEITPPALPDRSLTDGAIPAGGGVVL